MTPQPRWGWITAAWTLAALFAGGLRAADEPAAPVVAPDRLRGLVAGAFYRMPETDLRLPGAEEPLRRSLALPGEVEARWTTMAYGIVYAGGYEPERAERLFGQRDFRAREGQRLLARFDAEMAARRGANKQNRLDPADFAAMAPPARESGREGADDDPRRVDLLGHVVTLAALYARQPEDGIRAAAHVAFLASDEYLAEACARAAFTLLAGVLTEPAADRDDGGMLAANRAFSPTRERSLDTRALPAGGDPLAPPDAEARGEPARRLLEEGLVLLKSWDARFYLFALAGAGYGFEALPATVRAAHARSRTQQRLVEEWVGFQNNPRFLAVESASTTTAGVAAGTAPAATRGTSATIHRFLVGGRLHFW